MTSKAFKENYDRIDWSGVKPKRRWRHWAKAKRSSKFPVPYIVRPFPDPVQSMADGKYYTDAASLRATYKASGNPQGVDYIEVGDEDITKFEAPKDDRKAKRDAIERAIEDVNNGRVPPVLEKLPV